MSKGIEPIPRILTKTLPGTELTNVGGTLSYTGEGWSVVDGNGSTQKLLVWRGFFDLAGYELERLTFYLKGISIQDNQNFIGANTGTPLVEAVDVLTKTPLSDDDLNHPLTAGTRLYSPGFLDSKQDMSQVLMCRYREFYNNQNWTNPTLLQVAFASSWGEGTATAGAKIYITRYILLPENSEVTVPQSVVQLIGIPDREADAEYMMRLKRSYELVQ